MIFLMMCLSLDGLLSVPIQGQFKVCSVELSGHEFPNEIIKGMEYNIKGNTLFFFFNGKEDMRFPFCLRWEINKININLHLETKEVVQGILKLEGNKIFICYGFPNEARPHVFQTRPGERRFLLILEKIDSKK